MNDTERTAAIAAACAADWDRKTLVPASPPPVEHCPNCGDIGGPCGPGSDCYDASHTQRVLAPPPPVEHCPKCNDCRGPCDGVRECLVPAPPPPTFTAPPPPPPAVHDLPYGTQLRAGMGVSTVLADHDFETYSDAGYLWSDELNKWTCLPGAAQNKKGLGIVGSAVYAEHPSTEAFLYAYDLKDGRGRRRWRPGMPNPQDLFDHLAAGKLIEAFNTAFECHIWDDVCMPKYGWPPLPYAQVRCAQAKARAHALPPSLDMAAKVMGTQRKDPAGETLMKRFSKPKNPSTKSPARRVLPTDDPVAFDKYHDYNEQDIVAEADLAARVPDLSPKELEFWLVDQAINRRGVQVDTAAIDDCIAIVNQAHTQYNAELRALTAGVVDRASELEKLKGWLGGKGLRVDSLDAEHIEEEVAALRKAIKTLAFVPKPPGAPVNPEHVRYYGVRDPEMCLRALEIREAIGSAAVKKLFSLKHNTTSKGRVHDLFAYHGARTGRPTGSGPQPTNFPNSGPELIECTCGRHHGKHCTACPWCALPVPPGKRGVEWNPEAVEDALQVIASRSLFLVEMFFGDAMAVVCGVLRGMFIAKPGHRLVCADYNAIEAVVLAALAGEEWRLDVFRSHAKIYEASASAITGIEFAEFMKHAGYTDEQLDSPEWWLQKPANPGAHHPMRKKIGKVAELACFTARTQVLTDRGYVDMVGVLSTDKLWDGVEWVTHSGVVPKGLRGVLLLDGIEVTPNHPITCGNSWKEAWQLVSHKSILTRCLAFGSANLPLSARVKKTVIGASSYVATAERQNTPSTSSTFSKGSPRGVTYALKRKAAAPLKCFGNTPTWFLTTNTGADSSIASRRPLVGAIGQTTPPSTITAEGVFSYTLSGVNTSARSLSTSSPSTGGTAPNWKWTASTSTADTLQVTFGSLPNEKISTTGEQWLICNSKSLTLKPVFDISNAGPRNRFTIRTASGHLVVHNSGFAGWIGAWKAFGADEFFNDKEIKDAIIAWRNASPNIVEFWGGQHRGLPWEANYRAELFGLEGMAIAAVQNPGVEYSVRGFTYIVKDDVLYCRLLSGRYITYHRPRLTPSTRRDNEVSLSYEGYNTNTKFGPKGWIRMDTYSGKLVENIVQAVARDIHTHALVALERAGYPIVLHVYDEAVAEIPNDFGSLEEFERIMADTPEWAKTWPVRATGGWVGPRFRK